jgi:hypothetical protein
MHMQIFYRCHVPVGLTQFLCAESKKKQREIKTKRDIVCKIGPWRKKGGQILAFKLHISTFLILI